MGESSRRTALLPDWPRFLSRVEAAAYVGVSASTFDEEVAAGQWPPPRRRGVKGARVTWDRALLDSYADHSSGLLAPPAPFIPPPDGPVVAGRQIPPDTALTAEAAAMRGIADAQARNRPKRGPSKAA